MAPEHTALTHSVTQPSSCGMATLQRGCDLASQGFNPITPHRTPGPYPPAGLCRALFALTTVTDVGGPVSVYKMYI